MKTIATLTLCALLLCAIGCTENPEQIARTSIATATGAIGSAQADYTATCQKDSSQKICLAINKAVDAQNFAITGLETYCGFSIGGTLPDAAAKCAPQKNAVGNLKTVISNLDQAINELKSLTNKKAGTVPLRNAPDPELPQPMRADLTGGAISLGILGLKALLDKILKGEAGEVADDTISAVQGAIGEFEQVQGTDVTLGQLENLRLKHLWPDPAPATTGTSAGAGADAGAASPK